MNFVFGTVPSRRLGQSLGIDTIPLKTCNWNCVYCQLGRTMPLTNEHNEYSSPRSIIAQVRKNTYTAVVTALPGSKSWYNLPPG